uniref:Uncharacterized protein n=1 Tax=Vespula pensylvanica TaxID=30213 RepID=A0A834P7K3_VESPE|nr:hypothetical protein H0235_006394 [Vespula pensylvanica]
MRKHQSDSWQRENLKEIRFVSDGTIVSKTMEDDVVLKRLTSYDKFPARSNLEATAKADTNGPFEGVLEALHQLLLEYAFGIKAARRSNTPVMGQTRSSAIALGIPLSSAIGLSNRPFLPFYSPPS